MSDITDILPKGDIRMLGGKHENTYYFKLLSYGKNVGYVTSKTSEKRYSVKWITEDHSSWINTNINSWEKVCDNIFSESDAISCAQNFIDSQPDIY